LLGQIRNVMIAVALFAFAACASTGTRGPAASGGSEQIEELAIRFSTAVVRASSSGWAPDEVEALAGLYSEDAILFPPRGEPIKGRAAVRAYWTRSPDRRILKHRVVPARIEVDQVLATEYGHFEMTSAVGDGQPTEGRANYISIWKRDEAGNWRKHLDSWW
jgi:ketosteroid isomerase-like protein